MRIRHLLGAGLCAVVAAGSAAAEEQYPGPSEAIATQIRALGATINPPALDKIYAEERAKQPTAGVKRTNDVAYGPDERNKLDIFEPAERPAEAMPVVLFFHGGGFVRGDKSQRDYVGYFYARNGMVGLVPSYRLAPKNHWPAGAEDVVRAVEWARANAAAHGGDPNRIFVTGESAGAVHVAQAALMKRFQPQGGLPVAGAVLISGLYDFQLERMAPKQLGIDLPDRRNEAYFGTDPATYEAASTILHVDAPKLPLMMSYAEFDPVQMQVEAGAMFTTLCRTWKSCPVLQFQAKHDHVSQIYSFNTPDQSVSGPILAFIRAQPARH
jgi:triacylglycerol lipase